MLEELGRPLSEPTIVYDENQPVEGTGKLWGHKVSHSDSRVDLGITGIIGIMIEDHAGNHDRE